MNPQIPNIYDVADHQPQKKVSPTTLVINAIKAQGEYYTMREVADQFGIHIETLRRLCRTEHVKAPSKVAQQGKLVIYLFTPEDIEEIKEYFYAKDETKTITPVHGAKTNKA